jgi:hypothetical protein
MISPQTLFLTYRPTDRADRTETTRPVCSMGELQGKRFIPQNNSSLDLGRARSEEIDKGSA